MNTGMKLYGRPALALALALSLMAPGIAEAGKKERAIALGDRHRYARRRTRLERRPPRRHRRSGPPAASLEVLPTGIDGTGAKTAARGVTTAGITEGPTAATGAKNSKTQVRLGTQE